MLCHYKSVLSHMHLLTPGPGSNAGPCASPRSAPGNLLHAHLALDPTTYCAARHINLHHFTYVIICVTVLLLLTSACNYRTNMYKSFDNVRHMKGLRLVTLNARSLEKKIGQLGRLAHGLDYLCVTESWFNETIPTNTVNMPNMALFRTDRPNSVYRRGGGVACYVRYEYACFTVLCPELCTATAHLETVGVMTKYPGHTQRVIITAYKRPRGCTREAYKQLKELVHKPLVGNSEVWILGDLNVNTRARNTAKFRQLSGFLRKTHLRYLPTGPTHYDPIHGSTTLDHVYTNCRFVDQHGLLNDTISDHIPVFVTKKQHSARATITEITGRNYANYSQADLHTHLDTIDWRPTLQLDDPSTVYHSVISKIEEYLDTACPITTRKISSKHSVEFTAEVRRMIRKRKRLLKRSRRIRRGIYNYHLVGARRLMKLINSKLSNN